ncbi:MAG TPA: hypothetical protein VIK72_06525 [Clostridiaceae bacterium]
MINLQYIRNEISRKKAEEEIYHIIEKAKENNTKYICFDIETDGLLDADYKIDYMEFNDENCFEKFIKYEFAIYKVQEGIWC